jgi:aspartate aminotransferase
MSNNLSIKGKGIAPSITLEINAKAKSMRDSGLDVLDFGVGEPDFITPENIRNEAIEAINKGLTKYTPASGILELKKAICKKFKNDNNLLYNPSNIIVSNGAKHSIYNALMAIINPGDEVIIGVPYWVSYPELVRLTDGVPIYIYTREENNFKFSVDDFERVKTKKTKAIILNSPNNPTGAVYNEEELKGIADWAINNNVFVISDEIYEKLIYDDAKHISIASFNDNIKKISIIINGMSKAYAMTGWRIGYTAADDEIIKVMSNIQSHTTSNPNSISQYASVEALEGNQDSIEYMRKHFEHRRNTLYNGINEIGGLSCKLPEGSFYIMVNFSDLAGKTFQGMKINNSVDFANLLLEYANVAVVPGEAFGIDRYVRFSYATSIENIEKGIKRIKTTIEG